MRCEFSLCENIAMLEVALAAASLAASHAELAGSVVLALGLLLPCRHCACFYRKAFFVRFVWFVVKFSSVCALHTGNSNHCVEKDRKCIMLEQAIKNIHQLSTSPAFMACISSWFFAQFIKTVIKLITGKVTSIRDLFSLLLWRTGGMPSSHSALVCSLTTLIIARHGAASDLSIFSLCFAIVVIRDAGGVRRSSGIQARTINDMGKALKEKELLQFKPVREVTGHSPLEVIVGCFLGFFIGFAFSSL